MNINKYLTQKCVYEEKLDDIDEYSPAGSFGEPEEIACFMTGGKDISISDKAEINIRYNQKVTVNDPRVKQGDRINGQLVEGVIHYTGFDGKLLYIDAILKE